MTREIQKEVMHARRIATNRARRAGITEDRGLITSEVIAQRIFPEDGVNYLRHPLSARVNTLVDLALRAEKTARGKGVEVRFHK